MPEQPYPIQCQAQSCSKLQYGPVPYCPYCGVQTPVIPVVEAVEEPKETEQVTEESAPIATSPEIVSQVPISKTAPALDPKPDPKPKQFPTTAVETAYEKLEDKQQIVSDVGLSETTLKAPKTAKDVLTSPPKREPKPGKLKWIVVAIVVAGFVVYFSSQIKNDHPAKPSVSTHQKKNNRQSKPVKQLSNKTSLTPSFDCRKATTASERLICSNVELCQVDVQSANLYRAVRRNAVDKEALKKEQISWMKNQRDVCLDTESMLRVYKDRIAQLSKY